MSRDEDVVSLSMVISKSKFNSIDIHTVPIHLSFIITLSGDMFNYLNSLLFLMVSYTVYLRMVVYY